MVRPFKLTTAEVDEIWVTWRSGQAVKVLARETRLNPSTVRDLLHRTGGIRPSPKRRWDLWLSLAEREEISRWRAAGLSLREIAAGGRPARASPGRGSASGSCEAHWEGGQPAQHEPVAVVPVQLRGVDGQPDLREAGEEGGERDLRL
jgi:hypothetical protein